MEKAKNCGKIFLKMSCSVNVEEAKIGMWSS